MKPKRTFVPTTMTTKKLAGGSDTPFLTYSTSSIGGDCLGGIGRLGATQDLSEPLSPLEATATRCSIMDRVGIGENPTIKRRLLSAIMGIHDAGRIRHV